MPGIWKASTWFQPRLAGSQAKVTVAPPSPPLLAVTPATGPVLTIRAV